MMGYREHIPKEDMVIGKAYLCDGRNLGVGIWTGTEFMYMRQKWGSWREDAESHWDDGAPYGTCKPVREMK